MESRSLRREALPWASAHGGEFGVDKKLPWGLVTAVAWGPVDALVLETELPVEELVALVASERRRSLICWKGCARSNGENVDRR